MTTTEQTETELELEVSGFRIDGDEYPIPTLDSFDMDEGQILYDATSLTVEDFVPLGDDATEEERIERARELEQNVKNPAFLRALMTIAYRRRHPALPMGSVRDVIGAANHVGAMADFLRASVARARAGDPNVPLAQTPEPLRSSSGSSESSSASSGNGSEPGSAEPDEIPADTGHTRSDTSATSDPTEPAG